MIGCIHIFQFKAALRLLGCVCLCVCVSSYSDAHTTPRLHFRQVLDGLSQSNVRAIQQDAYGFVWIGTGDGLNRYDGQDVEVFEHDESDATSLPGNQINDLLIDSRQRLWVATYQSLALYAEQQGHFRRFSKPPHSHPNPELDALSLFEDQAQNLWVGTQHGVFWVDTIGQQVLRPPFPALRQMDSLHIQDIAEIEREIWFGTPQGIWVFHKGTKELKQLRLGQAGIQDVWDLFQDSQGNVWIGTTQGGLFRWDQTQSEPPRRYLDTDKPGLADSRIFCIQEDQKGRIWVGTEGLGLNYYSPETDAFVAFTQDHTDPLRLKTNSIWKIFEDRSGRLFLGTNYQGMFVYDPFDLHFAKVDQQGGQRLKSNIVSSFLEVGETLWIGTDGGGISVWDQQTGHYSYFSHDSRDPSTLGSNEVLSIFQDSKGQIWVGNWDGGLNRFDPETQSFHTYWHTDDPNSLGSNSVFSIKEDLSGNLWMSTWGQGVSRYNPETDDFFNIGYIQYSSEFLSHDMTYDLEVDDLTGDIWVATVLGVDRIRMQGDTSFVIRQFAHDPQNPHSLSGVNAHCILEDADHRLWVGTRDGLNLYNRETEQFRHFTQEDGLPGNVIKEIVQDRRGIYWITTTRGMARMEETPKGFHMKVFRKDAGLQADEFFFNASLISHTGDVYLGGVNGFNYFFPEDYRPDLEAPTALFTRFSLQQGDAQPSDNQSLFSYSLNVGDTLRLQPKQRSFSVEYKGISMTAPDKQVYRYRLKGFEEGWNRVGGRTVATYTNLDPGAYVLEVQAANRDGRWSNPCLLAISIAPAWWQTWWARLMFGLTPVVFFLSIAQIRIAVVKAQKRELARQVAHQTSELTSQKEEIEHQAHQLDLLNRQKIKLFSIISHDLRSPVNSLKGILNVLDPELLTAEDLHAIKEDLHARIDSVGNVMINLLEWSVGQMEGEQANPESFNLGLLTQEVCALYEEVAGEKFVALVNEVQQETWVYADPNHVRVILRNLVGNALKFSEKGDRISVGLVSTLDKEVVVKVADTGIGMSQDQVSRLFCLESSVSTKGTAGEKGVGLGLHLVKDFVEKNGGNISVESTLGVGTVFSVSLPRR